jgi:hypothetical protein
MRKVEQPLVCNLAGIAAVTIMLVNFAAALGNQDRANTQPLTWVFCALLACWTGAPFYLLAYAETFRLCAKPTWVLFIAGVCATGFAFAETYVFPRGSTTALVMVFIPLYMLVLYAGAWLVLRLWFVK